MRWLHIIDEDDIFEPGTGLFIVRDWKRRIIELTFIFAYASAQRADFPIDYNNAIVYGARIRKWWRWTLHIARGPLVPYPWNEEEPPRRFGFERVSGHSPIIEPNSRIERTRKPIPKYHATEGEEP